MVILSLFKKLSHFEVQITSEKTKKIVHNFTELKKFYILQKQTKSFILKRKKGQPLFKGYFFSTPTDVSYILKTSSSISFSAVKKKEG